MSIPSPNSTCFLVIGLHRGGTSCTSGVLHALGINMGDDLLPAGIHNERGHFEDREFLEMHLKLMDWRRPEIDLNYERPYADLIRRKEKRKVWGVKDPRFCYLLPTFERLISADTELKIVNVIRPLEDSAASLTDRSKGRISPSEARLFCEEQDRHRRDALAVTQGVVFNVFYDRLVTHPFVEVPRIARYLGREVTAEAVAFIDPLLRHHRGGSTNRRSEGIKLI